MSILGKLGVESPAQLKSLHLMNVLGAKAGHLVVREIRTSQLTIAEKKSEPVVLSDDAATAGLPVLPQFDALPQEVTTSLQGAGWKPESAPGQWKQWLPDDKVVNKLSIPIGAKSIRLKVNQYDSDREADVGCEFAIVPKDLHGFLNAISSMGRDMQWARNPAKLAESLLPHVKLSFLVTRADLSNPSAGTALLPLEPPTA
jgi:hypothetical protein